MATQALPFPAPRRRLPAPAASLAIVAATLCLSPFGPLIPGLWQWLAPMGLLALLGLSIVVGAGLLACHLAQMTAMPRPPLGTGLLPAALIPAAAIPGLGACAALPAAVIALAMSRRDRGAPVLLALGGTGLHLSALWAGPAAGGSGALLMLLSATLQIARASRPAANDNPSLERCTVFWALPQSAPYATPEETRNPPGE